MSYYLTNENSFLNINNAHLKVSGNVHADVMKIGAVEFAPIASNVTTTTNFTNVETGLTTSSNLHIGGTLTMGTVEVIATTHNLENTTTNGNITPHTVEFTNPTTSLVASGNVEVGGELTVSGNATFSGTGALTVPSGTTGEQPTGVAGMIRFNSTLNRLEVYNGTVWQGLGGISATGGTVTTSGGYKIHTFTDVSDTFTVISGGEVEYLVVAGGGGGGTGSGGGGMGGGGAGGLLTGTVTVGPGNYNVTVGDGGAGGIAPAYSSGTNGTDSTISFPTQVIADGGGKGATNSGPGTAPGGSGGSGGGGGGNNGAGGLGGTGTSGPPRQGYNGGRGGNGTSGLVYKGGGGGGAGASGKSYTNSNSVSLGLNGGIGIQSSINGNATYYAGGGGGGVIVSGWANTIYGGTGGLGGGGDGGDAPTTQNGTTGDAGTQNTGGGGGGGAYQRSGGGGGSGIVIIRYLQ
jgi:hypothetical protein